MSSLEQATYEFSVYKHSVLFDTELCMARTRTTDPSQDWIPKLAQAGLSGDRQRLELLLIALIRSLKRDSPEISDRLGALLAQYSANPGGLRWAETGPPPTDPEEGLALVRHVSSDDAPIPILAEEPMSRVNQFIAERHACRQLFGEGFAPPSSVLLIGLPGTGKSMLARWLAQSIELPLLVQDLATSISSFLGKTGLNLKRTLDYARGRSCVLLLDEFDAIAKRRDDASEVGELKRIVNVLLKELETWPSHSVLIAATNHPDLLDPAIRRRFHLVLHLPLPGAHERAAILERTAGRLADSISPSVFRSCASILDGFSGSDIETLMLTAVRRHFTSSAPLAHCLLSEMRFQLPDTSRHRNIGPLVRSLRDASSDTYTVRELAALFNRSVSTIQHHLKKKERHG